MLSVNVDSNDICQIIIPSTNLISGNDNSKQYFIKIANELINYDKFRNFIFKKQNFLSFQNIQYNLINLLIVK